MARRRQVIAHRVEGEGVPLSIGARIKAAIVCQSLGATKDYVDGDGNLDTATVTRGAGSEDEISGYEQDILQLYTVSELIVATTYKHLIGTHVDVSSDGDIEWLNYPLAPPTVASSNVEATGTLPSGVYEYAVGTFDRRETFVGAGHPANLDYCTPIGEQFSLTVVTPGSGEATVVVNAVDFAYGYSLFRKITGVWTLVADSITTTLVDDGSYTGDTAPTVNSTRVNPPTGDTYSVQFQYRGDPPATPVEYYAMADVYRDHGIGSEAANVARMVIGKSGRGNNAASLTIVPIIDASGHPSDSAADAVTALDKLAAEDVHIFTIMGACANPTLRMAGLAHAQYYSQDEQKKERVFITGATQGLPIGSASQGEVSITGVIATLDGSKRGAIALLDNQADYGIYHEYYEAATGVQSRTSVEADYAAVAAMGRIVSLPDTATPPLNKQIYALTCGETGAVYWTEDQKDTLIDAGGMVIQRTAGIIFKIAAGITCNTDIVEDSEISIVLTEDYMRRDLRDGAEPFRGRKISSRLSYALKDYIKARLDSYVKDELVSSYVTSSIEVEQDPDAPTWLIARFRYTPVYPCNGIEIDYGFHLTTVTT